MTFTPTALAFLLIAGLGLAMIPVLREIDQLKKRLARLELQALPEPQALYGLKMANNPTQYASNSGSWRP